MKRSIFLVLAGFLVLEPAVFGQTAENPGPVETLKRSRIRTAEAPVLALELRAEGFDVLEGSVTGTALQVVVSHREEAELKARGFRLELVEQGRPLRLILAENEGTVPAGYQDLAGIEAAMQTAAANFPNLCTLVDLTQTYGTPLTEEGRRLFAVKISDNPQQDENEPAFLMVSAHHCREIVTPVIALHAIDRLTSLYGVDPRVTAVVDEYEIWIAPMWNPDGYQYVFDVDNLWRKNRRVFPDGVGVDLNRNYPFGWDSACGGSTSTTSQTYRGPGAASEAETRTLIALSQDRHFAKVIDYHSSGREALWAYACHSHPFDAFLQQEAIAFADEAGYFGDNRSPSAEGEHFEWQTAQGAAFSFLLETHIQFQPSFQSAQMEAELVWPGTLWMLERPISLQGTITDAQTGTPLEATVTLENVNFLNGENIGSGGPFGRYHVFMPAGAYDVTYAAPGYQPQTHAVVIADDNSLLLDIALQPGACRGDINLDDIADILDFASVISSLGQGPGPADINGDGVVDLADLLEILPLWRICL